MSDKANSSDNLPKRGDWYFSGVILAVLVLLTMVMHLHTVWYLVEHWNQLEAGEYGHGYLVLLISAYLIYINRQRLSILAPCPEPLAVTAVFTASIVWLVAALVDIEALQSLGLLMLLLTVVWAQLGTQVTRVLVFPILYIGFAIPVWFPISPLLQEVTADVVFWAIRLVEIPALRIENMIVLPAGRLSIEEACSGLRYFLAALTLGTLFAYLNYTTFLARLTVVLAAAVAAVFANILRVYIVVYLGYSTEMQHPLIFDHLMFGWYIFGGVMVVLLFIDWGVHKARVQRAKENSPAIVFKRASCNKSKSQHLVTFSLSALLILSVPSLVLWLKELPDSVDSAVTDKLQIKAEQWSVIADYKDDWRPQYQGAMEYRMAFHGDKDRTVLLYLGAYFEQSQGKELIYYSNKITDDKVWRSGIQSAKLYDTGEQQVFEQVLIKDDGRRRLVWYWYHVAGQDAVNKYYVKALQVLGFFNGKRQATIVAIAAELDDDPESVREQLRQFSAEVRPSLIRAIEGKK